MPIEISSQHLYQDAGQARDGAVSRQAIHHIDQFFILNAGHRVSQRLQILQAASDFDLQRIGGGMTEAGVQQREPVGAQRCIVPNA